MPLNGPVAGPGTGVVVVTTFSNNGPWDSQLRSQWERIGRWWKGIFHHEAASSRLRSVQTLERNI
ncbi:hypothetical protein PR003_g32665 [Phytophthora rubi]|uniref:Uncharacterized protein n=1 Tax=Phytophthora rubi TaxID=129364 RepID=A0A6A3GHE0_9STRA|nr:hypothetical protein PR001_g31619 [Phytophthora rubi]KAE9010424.1 hypothetical protein PR002_g15357 [Phytophthora rubi]KAE9264811.1 hypothetical protein PR003_g32665 [Phytophthora rubi]